MKNLVAVLFAMLNLIAFSQTPSYVPTNGLVGWYPFNGNANDESGNGHHGQVTGIKLLKIVLAIPRALTALLE